MSKTRVFYIGWTEGTKEEIAGMLGCELGSFPTTYLGIPLSHKAVPRNEWEAIINKLKAGRTGSYQRGETNFGKYGANADSYFHPVLPLVP